MAMGFIIAFLFLTKTGQEMLVGIGSLIVGLFFLAVMATPIVGIGWLIFR